MEERYINIVYNNNKIQLKENGTTIMMLDGGNVGINNTNPLARLAICGGTADNHSIEFGYTSSGVASNYMESLNRNGGAGVDFSFYIGGAQAWKWYTSASLRMRLDAGLQVGAPIGGDKGVGTINVAGDIYKNNTAYTNPDYVFELYFTGKIEQFKANPGAILYEGLKTIDELKSVAKKTFRLPGIINSGMGIFKRSDFVLEKIEELHLYIFELHDEIKLLKKKLKEK